MATLDVLRLGLSMVAARWPTLLTIFLFGAAARYAVLWGVVLLSRIHTNLALFALPLAPLATLSAMLLMLRLLEPDLDPLAPPPAGGSVLKDRLAMLSSVLVPFLVLYAAQGYLAKDTRIFVHSLFLDAYLDSGFDKLDERFDYLDGAPLVILIVVALAIRWAIDRFDLAEKHAGIGIFGGYVEVLWMVTLAKTFSNYLGTARDWVFERRAVDATVTWWHEFVDQLGWFTAPLRWATQAVTNLLTHADVVFVIPIAWLVTGAVVYNRRIEGELDAVRQSREWFARQRERVPTPVRRWTRDVGGSLVDRFNGVLKGMRVVAVAGFAPVLLFCLVFVLARQARDLVVEIFRWVIGPRSPDTFYALEPYLTMAADAAYTILLVALLSAAIHRIGADLPAALEENVQEETARQEKALEENVQDENAVPGKAPTRRDGESSILPA